MAKRLIGSGRIARSAEAPVDRAPQTPSPRRLPSAEADEALTRLARLLGRQMAGDHVQLSQAVDLHSSDAESDSKQCLEIDRR